MSANRLFVLDTNILMHDPSALFRFDEHDVYLPMIVLEELDNHKRGTTEVARNVRQTNRFLDSLIGRLSHSEILQGVPIVAEGELDQNARGRLFLQTDEIAKPLPSTLAGSKADNSILTTALGLQDAHPTRRITLISKDINLRIKASALGIHAEDYYNDRVVSDITQLPKGIHHLPANFWDEHVSDLESWQDKSRQWYRFKSPLASLWNPNDAVCLDADEPMQATVREIDGHTVTLQINRDYHNPKNSVWGITARNREQNIALQLLMDPDIDFVSIQGAAGSGKTLLALAAGLSQCLDTPTYREIIMTRVTVPVGEDIGFLPGTEEEKMTPWMGALMDNLEVLHSAEEHADWERAATNDLIQNKIKIRSLNFMRGRTFLHRYIIIDEAQNLTSKQIKTLITRAGPGSKIVCLGDIGQIDTPYLNPTTSGLSYAIERFKDWQHSGHISLVRGERSRLADFAAETL